MKRTIALVTLFALPMLLALGGCSLGSSASNANSSLSSGAQQALNKFNAAVTQLKSLDLTAKQDLAKAKAGVALAWAGVKAHASELGQQQWTDLQAGYAKVSKALDEAVSGSVSAAKADLQSALSNVTASLKQFFGGLLKNL